jgi:hypothetical protein
MRTWLVEKPAGRQLGRSENNIKIGEVDVTVTL